MSKIVTAIAVLMLALAASASAAQDYRSPDAKPVVITQDYRSPDARPLPQQSTAAPVGELRSPDATPAGQFLSPVPQPSSRVPDPSTGSDFNWAYLAILIVFPLIIVAAFLLTLRRGRHVAVGS